MSRNDGVVGGDKALEGGFDACVVVGDLNLDGGVGMPCGEKLEGNAGDGAGDGVGGAGRLEAIDVEGGVCAGLALREGDGGGGGGGVGEVRGEGDLTGGS